ncbi:MULTISPECIES: ATP-binding protein [Streptomyces]|uniref:ATP-binding protein n=1 Tax=Streptomyces TaxID=1883 RepID=UPI00163BD2EE|nr:MULTISPECIES: ATP-binding protein [Streptomyces]MBC2875045.1 ATP-binding protein [Streptomyces sp. TYQ1024]UKW30068.1 ATP-binding protein [Streptomyces sp. TYQ1024]
MCPITTLAPAADPHPHLRPRTDFSLSFPPAPAWVGVAREAVRTAIGEVHTSELTEMAMLLTSELVTNAIDACRRTGCPAPVGVHVEWATGGVRVLVRDDVPGLPVPVPPRRWEPDERPERGNGMLIVGACATDWGVCRHGPGTGKTVWFQLGS